MSYNFDLIDKKRRWNKYSQHMYINIAVIVQVAHSVLHYNKMEGTPYLLVVIVLLSSQQQTCVFLCMYED